MKFDFAIGNPPYQDENVGSNKQAKPVYNLFMEEAYKVGRVVELITPARFLNQAGATPKEWNKKMLSSSKIKVLFFAEDSTAVFNGVDIKGGVVITHFNCDADYTPIGVFIKNDLLRSVYTKIQPECKRNVGDLVHSPDSYRFTAKMFEENSFIKGRTDEAHAKAVASSVFERYPEIFEENVKKGYVKIVGRKNGERKVQYTKETYINDPGNLYTWKLLIAGAIGTGTFGEILSEPIIAEPYSAHTQTFVSMGEFQTKFEAVSLSKYLKTRLARALLGIMKTTQNNQSKLTWSKIPLQDFTPDSDIDWSQSIAGIDQQLYKKYGLSPEEIHFIETHVKEMV
ncbi:Eco57I restriction-modification methylase domain-containing protein [Pygmaiobacter massiliensis]|uniref:Eco57I restriction-modification methylase domain-containing protein n=1 Tax=Pygmaiobacter massiliensis TaxID=1917873 RepID=UPI0028962EC0|nr:Eco57I restriction-modification methylase domain-containing protein [Pygmaiobacter massiliensis]